MNRGEAYIKFEPEISEVSKQESFDVDGRRIGLKNEIDKLIKALVKEISDAINDLLNQNIETLNESHISKLNILLGHCDDLLLQTSGTSWETTLSQIEEPLELLEKTIFEKLSQSFFELDFQKLTLTDEKLRLLISLASSKNSGISRSCTEILAKNTVHLSEKSFDQNDELVTIYGILEAMAKNPDVISEEQMEKFFLLCAKRNLKNFKSLYSTLIPTLYIAGVHTNKFAKRMLQYFLKAADLPSKEFLEAWSGNSEVGETSAKKGEEKVIHSKKEAEEGLLRVMALNLLTINSLESHQPGICKFLYENYGIRNFGRFPAKVWMAQFEESGKPLKHGLVINSRNDWNSSSYSDHAIEVYDKLFKDIHPHCALKVIEVKSKPELAKILNKLHKENQGLSPEFVIWSGHGSKNDFRLGPNKYGSNNYKNFITVKDLVKDRKRAEKYKKFFPPNVPMILDGCSVDEPGSLPKKASELLENNIISPDGNASVTDFGPVYNGTNFDFNVEYSHGTKTVKTQALSK